MAEIRLEGVAHSYDGGATWALEPLDLTWSNGTAYALLGPSGCGKTTLLNIISGLVRPTRGRVLFDGVDVTAMTTGERNIAQVFQFPVIYDTMTVRQNLEFPLRNRKLDTAAVEARVESVADLLGIADVLDHKARRLRADLQQLVSLGRGLAREDVAGVLLDEPLTVIDPTLKWNLRSRLKAIHRRTRHTLVYVTHDQTEALTFADEVVVLDRGVVIQRGSPHQLFLEPEHEFVGHFIGSPGMNFVDVTVVDGRVMLGDQVVGATTAAPGPARLGVRPEFVEPVASGNGALKGRVGLEATVIGSEHRGSYAVLRVAVDAHVMLAKVSPDLQLGAGSPTGLGFGADRTFLFRDGRSIGRVGPRVG